MSDRFSLKLLGYLWIIGSVFCAATDADGTYTLMAMGGAAYIASFFASAEKRP